MSCSMYRYTEACDGVDFCCGDCDFCNYGYEEDEEEDQ